MATTGGSARSASPVTDAELAKPGGWQQAVLAAIGAPHDPGTVAGQVNISFLDAWARAEGTKAQYNPLATTWTMAGATAFNSVGVKNYATPRNGVQATAATILSGYPNVVAALRRGDPVSLFSTPGGQSDLNKWVSGAAHPGVTGYITNISRIFYGEKGAGDWTSFDLGAAAAAGKHAAASAADAVTGGLSSIGGAIGKIAGLLGALFNLSTWRRAGLIVGGGLLMLGSLYLLASRTGAVAGPGQLATAAMAG